jgi:GNAT superfamily N-acetyltransferase
MIRVATVADADAIARVHIASSNDAYAPLAKEWQAPDLAERTRFWGSVLSAPRDDRADLVASHEDAIIGFISGGPRRENDVDAELEIYVIHILPEHRGRGVGGALWADACARLRGPTLRSMLVETFAELRCCAFYERRGGQIAAREAEDFHGGAVTRLVYRWAQGRAMGWSTRKVAALLAVVAAR